MDPYLLWIIYFIIVLCSLITIILAAIVIMRMKAAVDEREYNKWEEEWETLFLKYLLGDCTLEDISGHFRKDRYYRWHKRFFTPYLETLDGADFEATKAVCREIGLIVFCQKQLGRGSVYNKAIAARFLGLLRCRESIPERLRLLKSKNTLLVLAAAQGLAASGEPGNLRPVMKALLSDTFFTYEGTTEVLSRFGSDICRPITRMLDAYSKGIARGTAKFLEKGPEDNAQPDSINRSVFIVILIDLLGHYQYREALPVLNRLLKKADTEIIIHIMKAFLRIGETPEGFDPKPYLKHDQWVIRNFASQVTELSKDRTAAEILDQLLEDEQWWVRYHAARALLALGEAGLSLLKSRSLGPETAASGISSYILAKERLN